ncbi:MAG: hypothetical protein C4555_03125 [Dehalococcoidia bacterium]|nr:MAG: hypothetical protein C4555_03125 [Dehalococcoidia bacterium]
MPTAPTVISRAVAVGGPGVGNTDRLVIQIEDKIWQYGPNLNPLIRIANVTKKRSVGNQEFKVLNDKHLPRFTRINNGAGYNTTDTSIVVDNGNYAVAQMVVEVTRTGEHMLVTAVSSNTWTVERGYDTIAAGTGVAIVDNDEVRVLGLAGSERSGAPTSQQTSPGTVTNYAQLLMRSINLSEIRQHTEEYGPKELERQTKNTTYEFKVDTELFFKFGKPLKDVEGSSPLDGSVADTRYKTGGLKYWIDNYASANILDANSVITQTALWDFLAPLYEDMPEDATGQGMELMALCGSKAFNAFHSWAVARIETSVETKKYGLQLQTYQAPVGRLNLVQDYTLKGDEYADYMFVVNPKDLEYVYLQGMDMTVKTNVQANDVLERKDMIYGVIGLGIKRPELHGYIKNMQAAA